MKTSSLVVAALVATLVTGCSHSKSPAAVQRDVDKAATSGVKDIARAEQREQRTDAKVEQSVAKSLDNATGKEVNAALNTALAQADAQHKVSLAQCEGYAGDQQKACKAQADAAFEDAKARARAVKAQE